MALDSADSTQLVEGEGPEAPAESWRGIQLRGEFFGDKWDFGGGLEGPLTVWYGEGGVLANPWRALSEIFAFSSSRDLSSADPSACGVRRLASSPQTFPWWLQEPAGPRRKIV